MKVVQINATFGNGSTGTIVKDIQTKCLENGIENKVVYSLSSIPQTVINGYRMGSYLDRKLHALLSRVNGMQGYFSSYSTYKLIKWLETESPDALHLHNLHSNYINLPVLLKWAAKKNVAVIITLHDCWFFTGGCFHYTSSDCNKWQISCGECPRKKKDYPSLLFDRSKKILTDKRKLFGAISNLTIVGVSKWTAEEASKGIFKDRNCIYIYNGIDTSIFKPTITHIRTKYGLDEKFVVLGPASKWFMEANKNLLREFEKLGDDYMLVLYGCKGDGRRFSDNIITIGFSSNKEELARLYSMADIFVNCTHEDTFSMINAEAQACGTPVICYNNTGAKETVNTNFGRLVETDDVKGMINAIKNLKVYISSLDKNKKQQVRNILSQWAEDNFNKEINYNKYLKLYHSVIKQTC